MADEAIVVAARDEATAILKRIESQSVQLAGGVQQMAAKTEAASNRMAAAFAALAVAGTVITAIVGAVKALQGVSSGLASIASGGIDAFNAQEAATLGLTNALKIQGVAVDESMTSHRAFAAALQATTNIGDEATLATMRQAAMMGVADDQLQQTTLAATGLASALGISVDQALVKIEAAMAGNTEAIGRLVPSIREAATEEERFAMVLAIAERGLADAESQATTTAGVMARAAGAFGDLKEKIGELLAPFQAFISQGLAMLAEQLQVALQPAIELVTRTMQAMKPVLQAMLSAFHATGVVIGVVVETMANLASTVMTFFGASIGTVEQWGDGVAGVVQWAAEALIAGVTWMEVALQNLPAVMVAAGASIELFFIGLAEDAKYTLTDVVPAYLQHFLGTSEGWANTLGEGIAAAGKALADVLLFPWRTLAKIAPGIMQGVLSQVEQAMQSMNVAVDFAGMAIASLPDVAARELTAREAELQGIVGGIANDLGEQFNTKYNERVSRLGIGVRERLQTELTLASRATEEQVKEITASTGGSIQSVAASLTAVESRLLSRGRGDDPIQSVADNTRATVDALKTLAPDIAANLRQLLPATGDTLRLEMVG
jgi:hypothetical protein